ncbi:hypothetical protein BSL78_09733 [Apostichopus japonicus]|uniref:EamA domain-containing protein n=1 Tax=Stichopus japonicus TaxID=307972 RepID=A0A2G8KZF1_STIJA|nr:hypothetical protein BSL78_09733 [Apostichopus japonicus]
MSEDRFGTNGCIKTAGKRGQFCAIAYGFILAAQLSMAKELLNSFSAIQVTFIRCLVHLCCIICYSSWNDTQRYTCYDTLFYLVCSVTGCLAWVSTSATLYFLQVGDSTALELGAIVIFTALLGHCFLSERVNKLDYVILLSDVIGIILICKPEFLFGNKSVITEESTQNYGSFIALLSGFFVSIRSLFVKKLSNKGTLNLMLLMIFQGIGGVPICLLLSFFFDSWTTPSSMKAWLLLSIFGFTCLLQGLVHAIALGSEDVKTVAISSTISTVLTYVIRLAIFRASFDIVITFGATIITVTMVIMHIIRSLSDEQ